MPRGNRTGSLGFGPRTGIAAGYCARYPFPGYMTPVLGRVFLAATEAGITVIGTMRPD